MSDVTLILSAIESGDSKATDELLMLVYDELRALANSRLRHESAGHTLQATALVHEAYLRLIGGESPSWQNRKHFFCAAAEAMRRILVDHARRKKAQKRGGEFQRVDLDSWCLGDNGPDIDELLALNEALEKLEAFDTVKADLVKLRYFAGLTSEQAAQSLGMARSTAQEHWAFARAWLRVRLSSDDSAI